MHQVIKKADLDSIPMHKNAIIKLICYYYCYAIIIIIISYTIARKPVRIFFQMQIFQLKIIKIPL